jgi:hypothetical protein
MYQYFKNCCGIVVPPADLPNGSCYKNVNNLTCLDMTLWRLLPSMFGNTIIEITLTIVTISKRFISVRKDFCNNLTVIGLENDMNLSDLVDYMEVEYLVSTSKLSEKVYQDLEWIIAKEVLGSETYECIERRSHNNMQRVQLRHDRNLC